MDDFVRGTVIFRGVVEPVENDGYIHGAIVLQQVGKYVNPVTGFNLPREWHDEPVRWARVVEVS